jgi:hypothetical protein
LRFLPLAYIETNDKMGEKYTNSIPVKEYKLEGEVNFEEWIQTFEQACVAAVRPTNDNKYKTFLEWLPLKLDTNALRLYNGRTKDTYPDIKKELIVLYSNPHEGYRWKADPKAYQWDGKETLNMVAANVIRKVNRNEKLSDGQAQSEAHFFRSRMAMPQKYKKAIDMETVERQNRTLIKDLTKRLEQYGKTWVDHFAYAEWSFNSTPFAKTGMSPYFIFFGREPPLPSLTDFDEREMKDKDLRKYIGNMKKKVKENHQEARNRMAKQRAKDEQEYNKKTKHVPVEDGELVYDKVQGKYRNKLQPRWSGPIKVIRRRPSPHGDPRTTYVCQKPDGTKCDRNYEQLKRVKAQHQELVIALKPILKQELDDKETLSLLPIMAAQRRKQRVHTPVAHRTRSQTSSHDTDNSDQEDDTLQTMIQMKQTLTRFNLRHKRLTKPRSQLQFGWGHLPHLTREGPKPNWQPKKESNHS